MTARDNGLNIVAAINVSSIFYLVTLALTMAYLASVWSKMGPYTWLVLIIAVLSEITSYLQSITNSVLMVKDRGRFVVTSIIQSITKFIAIPVIMVLGWTIEVILWSTFFIVFIPSLYAFIYSLRYNVHAYDTHRYLKEVLSASWVPLMGYAINSFRSLDAMFIGIFGYAQLGIWYVIFILSKPFGYGGTLINVTYGELLERGRLNIIYRDLLILLLITTYVALTLSFFPGIYINLVRPSIRSEINLLVLPIILLAINSVLGNVNQFISNVMQGIDKRDIQDTREIRPSVYLRSLILHTHLAELIFTIVYLSTMIPSILLFKDLGFTYYAVIGALVSSLLANTAALGFRFIKLGSLKSVLNGRALILDYAIPSLLSIIILTLIAHAVRFTLYPSIIISLMQAVIASIMTLIIYFGIATAVSGNVRNIVMILIRRIINAITAPQP
ncbi:hypothetical protein [Vulcanisaeta sp. JCM 16159]|uniref:hypothetical protein n=1 Tax=Vulcanisaeta sp. JCM 16159 TaxID=1295371 RepID=UPI000A8C6668|nr:hypothetical protein [Vulcanisaeta sp. JCM 16159]